MAELALRRRRDAAAERVGHQLHAVADPEHRTADVVDAGIALRRAELGHALGPARQDDADRLARANRFERRVRRPHFRVHRQLAQSPRDQLRVLRTEIQNDDGLMGHGRNQKDRRYYKRWWTARATTRCCSAVALIASLLRVVLRAQSHAHDRIPCRRRAEAR